MKVVIDLSKEEMESYKNAMRRGFGNSAMRKIINGTPLPKGHGTLVEGKEVLRKIYDLRHRTSIFSNNDTMGVLDELIRFVDFMPVIVGADKEGAEE